jgi:hypothetical protein
LAEKAHQHAVSLYTCMASFPEEKKYGLVQGFFLYPCKYR